MILKQLTLSNPILYTGGFQGVSGIGNIGGISQNGGQYTSTSVINNI